MKPLIISGIQPTNNLTLGNYFGVIKTFLKLQDDYQLLIFVADLHALSSLNKIDNIDECSIKLIKYLLASGLDPHRVIIFRQSDIPQHLELFNFLLNNTTIGELSRMTQYKDRILKCKQANGTDFIPTGLLTYPVLMAADILLYNPDLVMVGEDQKQHLELTRNLAIRVNNKYNSSFFKVPNLLINEVGSKIMDLQDPTKKMSKSSENTKGVIFLSDDAKTLQTKIKSAITDNLNQVKFDLENQPGISNLMVIYACLKDCKLSDVSNQFKAIANYGLFKNEIIQELTIELKNLNHKFNQISDDDVNEILAINKTKVMSIAKERIKELYKLIKLNI